jgi:RecA/RadA recombinase
MSFSKDLRKTVQKYKSGTIAMDFAETELWSSIGNFATNRLVGGSYYRGIVFGRSVMIGGKSGSGKSLYAATIAKNAQKEHSAFVVWVDVEKATTGQSGKEWLRRLDVNVDEDNLLYLEAATIEDVKGLVSDIAAQMKKDKDSTPVVVVIDSLGMIMSETQMKAAMEGKVINDQGLEAKQRKDLVTATTHLSSRLPLSVITIVHTMASRDKYDPDEILTGGRGAEYAASTVLVVNKMKMRADQLEKSSQLEYDAKDNKKIIGIRSKVQVYKSRFSKPHEKVFVQIPWGEGLDPYSGLFELMKSLGEIYSPSVGWYAYKGTETDEVKFREKDFRNHADTIMQLSEHNKLNVSEAEPTEETDDEEETA